MTRRMIAAGEGGEGEVGLKVASRVAHRNWLALSADGEERSPANMAVAVAFPGYAETGLLRRK